MPEATQPWRELLEHLTDMVLVVDRHGRLCWSNHGMDRDGPCESGPRTLADVLSIEMASRVERAAAELEEQERCLELAEDHANGERHLEFRLKPGPPKAKSRSWYAT